MKVALYRRDPAESHIYRFRASRQCRISTISIAFLSARGTRSREPDSGHADTISLTIRVRLASQDAMKARIQCVLTP